MTLQDCCHEERTDNVRHRDGGRPGLLRHPRHRGATRLGRAADPAQGGERCLVRCRQGVQVVQPRPRVEAGQVAGGLPYLVAEPVARQVIVGVADTWAAGRVVTCFSTDGAVGLAGRLGQCWQWLSRGVGRQIPVGIASPCIVRLGQTKGLHRLKAPG